MTGSVIRINNFKLQSTIQNKSGAWLTKTETVSTSFGLESLGNLWFRGSLLARACTPLLFSIAAGRACYGATREGECR